MFHIYLPFQKQTLYLQSNFKILCQMKKFLPLPRNSSCPCCINIFC